jgi:mycoredoxin
MKITIYGTNECSVCNRAKRFFEQHSLAYDFIEVGKDISVSDYVAKTGLQTVPFIEIDDNKLYGYNEISLKKYLNMP